MLKIFVRIMSASVLLSEQALRVFSNCVKTNNLKSDNEDLEMTFLFEV